jgi:hypothetical protein
MPLLDHFHPPLGNLRHWESFHARWATAIADALEAKLLPAGYFAEVQVHVGTSIEVDVGTFSSNGGAALTQPEKSEGGVAVAEAIWAPPAPAFVMPGTFPDEIEVRIFQSEGGPTLVAAIELLSPHNKDRPETRKAFAAKCISYLSHGIGLVIVDAVTSRQANMHTEIVNQMGLSSSFLLPGNVELYAIAYRPVDREESGEIHVWPHPLAIGAPLPTLPLALRDALVLPLDLEATYADVCRRTRLP